MAEKIISVVCEYYSITRGQIESKERTRYIAHARQVCCYLLRKYTDIAKSRIASEYFGTCHTTVIHSIQIVENEISTNARGTRTDVERMSQFIEGEELVKTKKIEDKYFLYVKCRGREDEYYGGWDDLNAANRALQDRISVIIAPDKCAQSKIIKVKIIN